MITPKMKNQTMTFTRRRLLASIAGGAAGLALGSLPHRVLAQAGTAPLKISTIGAGREGAALGTLLVKAGHQVMFSSRHPEELKTLVDGLGPLAHAGTVAEAVDFGDVVLVIVPYSAMEQIGKDYGASLAKKTLVLDVSNPVGRREGEEFVKKVADQGGPGLVTAKLLPGAHIVRGFNAVGFGKLADDAKRPGDRVAIPIAGDDQHALDVASGIIREIGFEPVVVGGLAMGKYLVPGTPLAGEHTVAEIRQILTTLH
jgi:8-hydroxy-5-deazaflavin:NADPH oxidoreductase